MKALSLTFAQVMERVVDKMKNVSRCFATELRMIWCKYYALTFNFFCLIVVDYE